MAALSPPRYNRHTVCPSNVLHVSMFEVTPPTVTSPAVAEIIERYCVAAGTTNVYPNACSPNHVTAALPSLSP